jgi:hypothetical protein
VAVCRACGTIRRWILGWKTIRRRVLGWKTIRRAPRTGADGGTRALRSVERLGRRSRATSRPSARCGSERPIGVVAPQDRPFRRLAFDTSSPVRHERQCHSLEWKRCPAEKSGAGIAGRHGFDGRLESGVGGESESRFPPETKGSWRRVLVSEQALGSTRNGREGVSVPGATPVSPGQCFEWKRRSCRSTSIPQPRCSVVEGELGGCPPPLRFGWNGQKRGWGVAGDSREGTVLLPGRLNRVRSTAVAVCE